MNLKNEFNNEFSSEQKNVIALILEFVLSKGFNAYLIGGVVRDLILKRPIFDLDIVVESDAILFAQELVTFTKGEIVCVQENLRTAKVLFENGVEVDFSSTRKEHYISSGQLPVLSEFGCPLKDDVKRRDFTINTLALKLDDFELIDYLNGLEDIKNKKLRVLHDKSFIDDPSRLVRLLKFLVRFDFEIEEHTKELIEQYLKNIDNSMPLERIKGEFRQLFSLNIQRAFDKTVETGIYKLVSSSPEQFSQERLDFCLENGFICPATSWFVPLACLTVNSSEYWDRLNLTSQERKCLSDFHDLLFKNYGHPALTSYDLFLFEKYSKLSQEATVCEYVSTGSYDADRYLNELKDVKVLINGNDLISLGFVPSEKFKEIFDEVLKHKFNNELQTKEEELEFVKKFL